MVIEAIREMRTPIMIAHVRPDADALGALLAMAMAWKTDRSQPKVALPNGSLSKRLGFLFDWAAVSLAAPEDFPAADGFVVLDTAKKSRCNLAPELGQTDWSAGRPVVNIDHHATNTRFGDVNWVVDKAGSTCELVYYLLHAAERPIAPATASLLFAGIQSDTIGFSLPTCTASALRACAELVEAGAAVGRLGEHLWRGHRQCEFDLLRIVYANTLVLADGQLAYSSASYEEIHGAGCTAADIDEQVNIPRSLEGVRLAILFTEGRKGQTRINLRSSGNVTVADLAGRFGGGGHSQAAGVILDCGLEEAINRVLPQAVEHLSHFARG